ncbi:MAG: hypothetical protein V1688_02285, partial [bacterium]
MGYESPELAKENANKKENIETRTLKIDKDLTQERTDHAGITPAFRTLGELVKELSQGFGYNSIGHVEFLEPLTDLNGLKCEYAKRDENNIDVTVYLGSKKALTATFFTNDYLTKKVNNNNVDYNKTAAEGDEMRKVLPQEGDIVMIDNICYLDDIDADAESKVVSIRKVDEADFEEGETFNKFRLIEMIGQAGSYYFLSKKNIENKPKMMIIYNSMNVNFYPAADDIKINDE